MKFSVASDHAGFMLKEKVLQLLSGFGCSFTDLGTFAGNASCDYPDFAFAVAQDVQKGRSDSGVLICGSGIGMSIVANKYKGIRAALCHNKLCAQLAREHNNANILCLGARFVNEFEVGEILKVFLESMPSKENRHIKRLGKMDKIDKGYFDVF